MNDPAGVIKKINEFGAWIATVPSPIDNIILTVKDDILEEEAEASYGMGFSKVIEQSKDRAVALTVVSIDRLAEMGIKPGGNLKQIHVVEVGETGQIKSQITVDDPFKEAERRA